VVVVVVVVSSLMIVLAVNPLQQAYSINPTNPTDDIIKRSISSISNDPSNSSTQWISTGVYKMEKVTTFPTFNTTFYMVKTDGTSKHKHSIYDFKLNTDPIVKLICSYKKPIEIINGSNTFNKLN
jgi:hypothetical protein